jgi:hypothetical protein
VAVVAIRKSGKWRQMRRKERKDEVAALAARCRQLKGGWWGSWEAGRVLERRRPVDKTTPTRGLAKAGIR